MNWQTLADRWWIEWIALIKMKEERERNEKKNEERIFLLTIDVVQISIDWLLLKLLSGGPTTQLNKNACTWINSLNDIESIERIDLLPTLTRKSSYNNQSRWWKCRINILFRSQFNWKGS